MIDRFEGKYAFLSNFYISPVTMYGEVYPSVEHAFQAAKVEPGKAGNATRAAIRSARSRHTGAPDPGWAKHLGRRVKLREDWEQVKVPLMKLLLIRKFQVPELRYLLASTAEQELVEGNIWGDTFWGVCNGVGENNLGILLMEVRSAL